MSTNLDGYLDCVTAIPVPIVAITPGVRHGLARVIIRSIAIEGPATSPVGWGISIACRAKLAEVSVSCSGPVRSLIDA